MTIEIFGRAHACAKGFTDGTHRTRSPAETLAAYQPLMARCGITRLANVTGLDDVGLPVYVAIRPNSRGLATSQGKGATAEAAKASALMEAIESWHAEHIDRPVRYQSYLDLREQAAVCDVDAVDRKAGTVLRLDTPMPWIEGWDLIGGGPMWVPLDAVTTNFVNAAGFESPFFRSSNGLASGNHLLEACGHALFEVIERDALSLWFVGQQAGAAAKPQQLDLASVDDPPCRASLDLLAAAGIEVAAWDITSDTGIPTYACSIIERLDRPRWRPMGSFAGYGTHLHPGVALMRAISEAIQSRLTLVAGARDDLSRPRYAACSNPDDQRRMLHEFASPPPALDFRRRRSLATDRFETDLLAVVDRLRAVGIAQAVVVDLSKPELGIPVVKAVVPGLEGVFLAPSYRPGARARARMEVRA